MTNSTTPELPQMFDAQKFDDLVDDLIETIAKEQFTSVETLETRKSDSLDFHDVAVWQIKEALRVSFFAGVHYGANVVGGLK